MAQCLEVVEFEGWLLAGGPSVCFGIVEIDRLDAASAQRDELIVDFDEGVLVPFA